MRQVYFIKPIGWSGPVKIGCSRSPDGRRRTLATWSPFPLEIVAEIEGHEDLERRFHALFESDHRHREWFNWSPRLQDVIDAVASGKFDIESLPPPRRLQGDREATSRAHKASWTPKRRKLHSLLGKARWAFAKSGRICPENIHVAVGQADSAALGRVEQYIADPEKYGRTNLSTWNERELERLRRRLKGLRVSPKGAA